MLPDVPDLNDAFASLAVGVYSDLPKGERALACEAVNRADAKGPCGSLPEIGIAYHRSTKIRLNSLIDRVEKELAAQEHALFGGVFRKKRPLATKVLCLAVACSATKDQVRPTLNVILESVSESILNPVVSSLHRAC
jgi:hypothetical protein